MPGKQWHILGILAFMIGLLWLGGNGRVLTAQGEPSAQLFITATNAGSPPILELQLYGIDARGEPLDLHSQAITLRHNGLPATAYEFGGSKEVGVFTLFLIDIPEGVNDQFAAVEQAIKQYAAPPVMKEQVDAVAIYEVGENGPRSLLPPDRFYNSVTNFFESLPPPSSGPTALIDSAVTLLAQIPDLKPDPAMAASLVIISDGTDAVSTQYQRQDVAARANELGIPVHTIWLVNNNLSALGQQQGQDYMTQVASNARGLAVKIESPTDWAIIWNRIISFRNQTIIRYQVPDLQGGTFPVELALLDQPETTATAEIRVPINMPSILIDLPEESRTLTLPNLDSPVRLRLTTSTRWLDGVARTLTAAQLVVNGVPQEVKVTEINAFIAEIGNLGYGANTLQLAVLDEQGMRATSPVITLQVNQGRQNIPSELDAGGGIIQTVARGMAALLILLVVAAGLFVIWRQGWLKNLPLQLPRGRSRRRASAGPQITYEPEAAADEDGPRILARLVVLEAISKMPPEMPLIGAQVRLGRSLQQADIAFENDITVSRLHATMMLEGIYYRIFDEGSTSGTWVNGKQVPEYGAQLADGDEINLGAVHLRFYQP